MEFYGDERTGQPAPQVGPLKGRRRGGIILAENLKIRFFGEKPVLPPKLPPNCVVKGETRRTGQDGRFPKIPINQRAMVLRGTRRDGGPRISRPVPSTTRSPIRNLYFNGLAFHVLTKNSILPPICHPKRPKHCLYVPRTFRRAASIRKAASSCKPGTACE